MCCDLAIHNNVVIKIAYAILENSDLFNDISVCRMHSASD